MDMNGSEDIMQQETNLDRKMSVTVSSIIGNSHLSTLNPITSVLDCMETFSSGVHRALVPLETEADNVILVKLNEASPGYRMLIQMDVLRFLSTHNQELKDIILQCVQDSGAINETVFAVTENTKVIEAIKSMRAADLSAVPIVEDVGDDQVWDDGKGSKLVGTFSATDLRDCPISLLQSWLLLSVSEFKERLAIRSTGDNILLPSGSHGRERPVVCSREMSLANVIELAIANHVHRVWVVDEQGLLRGLVSLTDMIRAVKSLSITNRKGSS